MLADRLRRAVSQVRPPGKNQNARLAVGDFEYKTTELEMGDLSGNRFSIVLRQALFLCNICVVFRQLCHLENCILSTP